MEESRLKELLKKETLFVEYKEDRHGFSDSDLIDACVGMANAEGGYILIGVRNDGTVVGSCRVKNGQWKNPEALECMILERTNPKLSTEVSFCKYDSKEIVLINVPKAAYIISTSGGKYLRRRINSKNEPVNDPMTPDDVINSYSRIGTHDFSSTVLVKSSMADINLDLVSSYCHDLSRMLSDPGEIEVFKKDPVDILKILALIEDDKPTVAAILLFGTASALLNKLPNHYVQYQVFGKKSEIIVNEKFNDPISILLPNLLALPDLNNKSDEFLYRGQNISIPEYAPEALREALANALVHRDYTMQGGIMIQVMENELAITSAGGLPNGVKIDKLLSAIPTPRNRRLNDAMRRLKLVESSGRGIDFIYRGQARYGRPAPDYSATTDNTVSVRLIGGAANLDFCKFIFSLYDELGVSDLLLLNRMFFKRDITVSEASALIQQSEYVAEQLLYRLNKNRLVEISNDRDKRYFLKGSLSHAVRRKIKPARLTYDDFIKYSNDILKALDRNRNGVKRGDIADAVGLSDSQTYRLLASLLKAGKIRAIGRKWFPPEK